VNPNAVNPATIGTSVWSNRVDVQWQPATDNANGIGLPYYYLTRDGTVLGLVAAGQLLASGWVQNSSPTFSDQTLLPGRTYNFAIFGVDFHQNVSSAASFTVTTPGAYPNPTIPTPPIRTGVRPIGTYWGAGGEQIDLLSGPR
jgi:hypothetical protein